MLVRVPLHVGDFTAIRFEDLTVSVCDHSAKDSVLIGRRGWSREQWPELTDETWLALDRRLSER